jgi:hypothetical protein
LEVEAIMERHAGYYWIVWTDLADTELRIRRPGPLIGEWDGRFWWFARMDVYKFDREVEVIGTMLHPQENASLAEPSRGALQSAAI